MKKSLWVLGVGVALLLAGVSGALAEKGPATVNPAGKMISISERAVEVSPGVFALGQAVDPATKQWVDGYAFVHYKQGLARGGAAKPAKGGLACYGFLARGAKWKTLEPWIMNTANTRGLEGQTLFNIEATGIAKWEAAAGVDILGNGDLTAQELSADSIAPDEQNEVYFGEITDANAIAVTTVWGVFGGPTFQRYLAEWDMVFDQADYDWSTVGESGKMDFDNIATHELGHAVGMADLYNSGCNLETMFGYAGDGEINKRDLNAGDILGISTLY